MVAAIESVLGFELSGSVVRAGAMNPSIRLSDISFRVWKESGANGKGEDHERCGARSEP